MLKAIEPIYNALFQTILDSTYAPNHHFVQIKGEDGRIIQQGIIQTFDRGFWYKGEECVHFRSICFPYGFLDSPYWDPIEFESAPMGFQVRAAYRIGNTDVCGGWRSEGAFFPGGAG